MLGRSRAHNADQKESRDSAHLILFLGILSLLLLLNTPILRESTVGQDDPKAALLVASDVVQASNQFVRTELQPRLFVISLCEEGGEKEEDVDGGKEKVKRGGEGDAYRSRKDTLCVRSPVNEDEVEAAVLHLILNLSHSALGKKKDYDYSLVVFGRGTTISQAEQRKTAQRLVSLRFFGSSVVRRPIVACTDSFEICAALVRAFLKGVDADYVSKSPVQAVLQSQVHVPSQTLNIQLNLAIESECQMDSPQRPFTIALLQYYSAYLRRLLSDGGDSFAETFSVTSSVVPRIGWKRWWKNSAPSNNSTDHGHRFVIMARDTAVPSSTEALPMSRLHHRPYRRDAASDSDSIVLTLYDSGSEGFAFQGADAFQAFKQGEESNISSLLSRTTSTSIIALPYLLGCSSPRHTSEDSEVVERLALSVRDALEQNLVHHLGLAQILAGQGEFNHERSNSDDDMGTRPGETVSFVHSALPLCWSRLLQRRTSLPLLYAQTHAELKRFAGVLDRARVSTAMWTFFLSTLRPSSKEDKRLQVLIVPDASLRRTFDEAAGLLSLLPDAETSVSTLFLRLQRAHSLSQYLTHHPSLLPQPFTMPHMLAVYCPYVVPLLVPLFRHTIFS